MDAHVRGLARPCRSRTCPPTTRPREKLLRAGPAALADAELLALLLRTGLPGQGVLELAQPLLERFGGLAGLLHADAAALTGIKGLGPAKRAELAAVLEIARRALAQQLRASAGVRQPRRRSRTTWRCSSARWRTRCSRCCSSTASTACCSIEEMFRGTLTQTSVYPREVVRRALELNAARGDPGAQPPVGRWPSRRAPTSS